MKHTTHAYLNTRRDAMCAGYAPSDLVTPSEAGPLTIDADCIRDAASRTFGMLNDRPGATERSLSVGDVIHVVNDTHAVWLTVEALGFDLIDAPSIHPAREWAQIHDHRGGHA
jgi:hypothetical protein